ncbi:tRNA threonylcarbamoyladenosine biosynthesis protein TsaE [Ventosimonas gracilis]|uniref:tRNA threonylcarbamoyladenosine biosynthesis protein TsaE n=1 Tax=Ventosimonas gracilis TaxID=1680762 RepID=A0A139SVV6_9GAMM|nr:tRNA (adenosine(37)-N6)-threonylcarbamoyltransferase complex ATPase subunit type 1 TsaE [Ventosimonas gracilis]KXU38727.1 tRNA threonylcarbamoyladenosine biosynthesis protein TsaE [Ventosimonas gracilis]
MSCTLKIADETAMLALGGALAALTEGRGVIYLHGNLGMGKTTLARGIIRALGYQAAVKSPTFTLIEPYEIGRVRVFHFDLYRLLDAEELEFLGARDCFADDALCLVEWPERGEGVLPAPDLVITISPLQTGRDLKLCPASTRGEAWCRALAL